MPAAGGAAVPAYGADLLRQPRLPRHGQGRPGQPLHQRCGGQV